MVCESQYPKGLFFVLKNSSSFVLSSLLEKNALSLYTLRLICMLLTIIISTYYILFGYTYLWIYLISMHDRKRNA